MGTGGRPPVHGAGHRVHDRAGDQDARPRLSRPRVPDHGGSALASRRTRARRRRRLQPRRHRRAVPVRGRRRDRVQPGNAAQPAGARAPPARLVCGQFLALSVFIGLAVVLAILVAAVVAFVLAPSKGIHTSAWTSSAGLSDLGQSILHVYLTCIGYGVLGTALAIILRSPAVAIALGVAYALPGEAIINALWSNGDRWLPGQLLSALAHGGTSSASYGHALLTLTIYAVVVGAGTLLLFRMRDAA